MCLEDFGIILCKNKDRKYSGLSTDDMIILKEQPYLLLFKCNVQYYLNVI